MHTTSLCVRSSGSRTAKVEIFVEAPYEFIADITAQRQDFRSSFRQSTVSCFKEAIERYLECIVTNDISGII